MDINNLWNNLLSKGLSLGIPYDTIKLAKKVAYNLLAEDEDWTKSQLEEKKKTHGENFWITNNSEHCYCFYYTNTAFRNIQTINPSWPKDINKLKIFIIGEINLLYKTWYYYNKYQKLERESNEEHQKMRNELRSKKKSKFEKNQNGNKKNFKEKSDKRNRNNNYKEEMELFNRLQQYSRKTDTITFLKNAHKNRIDCLLSKIMQMLSYLVGVISFIKI
ncbi:Hypothetical protein SRAE_0000027300 [Strongyloides ratti]|uniref:Uncharacterized protein n=1 Tax=Strongyloides ratti TaxID=34506 RepID=A0A090KUH0_STRRB|nr:Hypothetical protein SRAE_0000027300 [Strongyloides ratti]CEF61145.1 Hypothetical protein SRAE_0000027300 [Strongyloides ratti]